MAKVTAIACDREGCDSVAKGDENGAPAGWAVLNVTRDGRSVISGAVLCSNSCLVTYVRDMGDVPAKRRRRTKDQIEADRLAAEANGDVPEVGTEAALASNA